MLWGCCEFRGGNRVQRGKYPGFQMDSEAPVVTLGSRSCSGAVMGARWNRKKVSRDRPVRSAPDPSRSPSRGKMAGRNHRRDGYPVSESTKTRVAVARIWRRPPDRFSRSRIPQATGATAPQILSAHRPDDLRGHRAETEIKQQGRGASLQRSAMEGTQRSR